MTKQEIYERMTIQFIDPDPEIEFEFGDGKPCWELYDKMSDARMRLAERTGIDYDDKDMVTIISCMEQIAKICALKMYDYGTRYGVR